MKSYLTTAAFVWLIYFGTFAQNQNNNWYFGNRGAISFASGNPVGLATSTMVSIEGCASVSDPVSGNLLFYSNGLQVWDANNTVMPNGNGLLSGPATSATQGVQIVPYPGNASLYFLFTVDETNNNGANGLRYSIVDMSQNNGLGDILPQQKNILIQTNSTERMAVTRNANSSGYWLVIHERNNNCFKAYQITSAGINTTPVVTNIGAVHSTVQQANGDATMGYMKFSSDGQKIAVAIYASNQIELFDFDNCTGILSNTRSITTIDNPYGIEFSPDNSKLYYSLYFNASFNGAIYQTDVTSATLTPQLIGVSSSFNSQSVGALQLGPDNKIYAAINSESWLSCISQPNNSGIACGFIDQAVFLPNIGLFPTTGLFGLPAAVLDLSITQPGPFTIAASGFCFGDSTRFEISNNQSINSIVWNFGLPSSPNNSSTLLAPSMLYPDTGLFEISAIINPGCPSDTLTLEIVIQPCDSAAGNCELIIPNVFTPNQDGINDRFSAINNCQTSFFELLVYNRWGNLIWSTTDQNDSWNGEFNGMACSDGVYFYIAKVNAASDFKTYSGTITLIR